MEIKVLDYGYVKLCECWGNGGDKDSPEDYERGIIMAARQSTQASFRGWDDVKCTNILCVNGLDSSQPDFNIPPHKQCTTCEGKGYLPGDARLLKYLFTGKPQHATPFEFAGMVIEVQAPIFVYREWHRHRTQSYNEMSARYAPLPDLNYVPTVERCLMNSTKNKQAGTIKGADELTASDATEFRSELAEMYVRQEEFYQKWLKKGVPKELARIDLPIGRYSRMRASANLRNWLAFMTLRADPMAQWEIQQFAHAVGTIISEKFPRTWDLYKNRV